MYCNHCGTELPNSAVFCTKCGKRQLNPITSPLESPTGPEKSKPGHISAVRKVTKIGIAVGLLIFVALAFWPAGYAGRFTPRSGTNLALDNKTGQSCRMSGEKTPDWKEKYGIKSELPPPIPLHDTQIDPILLCSEVVRYEEYRIQVITQFVGTGLLVLLGIYATVRHWRRKV